MKIDELKRKILEEWTDELDNDKQFYAIPSDTSILPYVGDKLITKIQRLAEVKPILFVPKGWEHGNNAYVWGKKAEVIENE